LWENFSHTKYFILFFFRNVVFISFNFVKCTVPILGGLFFLKSRYRGRIFGQGVIRDTYGTHSWLSDLCPHLRTHRLRVTPGSTLTHLPYNRRGLTRSDYRSFCVLRCGHSEELFIGTNFEAPNSAPERY
jgi:hypothetical protein